MNTITKSVIGSIIAAIIVVAAGLGLYRPASVEVQQQQETAPVHLGGSTPEISSPYLIVNGVSTWYQSNALNQGSSTPCSFLSGSSGTTTMTSFGFNVTTSTTTALIISLATSTNQYATTTGSTPFATTTLASGAKGSFLWDPGYQTGLMPGVSSTTYIVMGVAGILPNQPSSTNLSIAGTCFATWTGYQ